MNNLTKLIRAEKKLFGYRNYPIIAHGELGDLRHRTINAGGMMLRPAKKSHGLSKKTPMIGAI